MAVSEFGGKDFIQRLVEKYGAKVNITDNDERTALAYAVEGRHVETVKYLVEEVGMDVNHVDRFGNSILSHAIENNPQNFEIVDCLVRNHADLGLSDKGGRTAIMIAALLGRPKTVEYLAKAGANTNDVDKTGHTVLMYAVKSGCIETVRFLVERTSVNVNRKNIYHGTALTESTDVLRSSTLDEPEAQNHVNVVEYLINMGSHIDKNFFLSRSGRPSCTTENFPMMSFFACLGKPARWVQCGRRIEIIGTIVVHWLKKRIRNDISELFFTGTNSLFPTLDDYHGTFGHYLTQTITEYIVPDANGLSDLPDGDWSEFLDQMNSRKCCDKWKEKA
jgi:ankyrin repeat protein